jgi:hypothetical protein
MIGGAAQDDLLGRVRFAGRTVPLGRQAVLLVVVADAVERLSCLSSSCLSSSLMRRNAARVPELFTKLGIL